MPAVTSHPDNNTAGPTVVWLGLGLLLAGLGTVLLGPILPAISHRWHLSDQQTGPLFFAKFVGSFLGGISVPRKIRNGILSGTILSCIGFGLFALATSLLTGSLTLFIAGIGLGQIIASTNVLAGHRYTHLTGSALSTLNFFFSLGAVITGLIVAAFVPRIGLSDLIFCMAAVFLATGIGGRFQSPLTSQTSSFHPSIDPTQNSLTPNSKLDEPAFSIPSTNPTLSTLEPQPSHSRPSTKLSASILVLFAAFLFFYGGLETCLVGWLTTYTIRYSNARLVGGQSAIVLLLIALTAGRAIFSVVLRYIGERTIQRLGLLLSFLFIAALSTATHAAALSLWSIALGLSLAPFFPATFALLMHRSPTAREAGFILAVSGLGAATFPWLMGIVSTQTGSLRIAMAVPAALTLLLLAISFVPANALPS